jgi:gamma-glutamylcyclotransferase (GGCT)/AIG2-like uncharacterized protein YtfP
VPRYFAYGSNLDEVQLCERCPGAAAEATGALADFRLAFTAYSAGWGAGVADVVACPGSRVWGVVFSLTDDDLESLDRFEGYPEQYDRFVAQIVTDKGVLDSWVYAVNRKQSFVAPNRRYLDVIRQAAGRHGFPDNYVRMLEEVQAAEG